MIARKCFKNRIKRAFLRYFFAILSIITLASGLGITSVLGAENVYAEPDDNITNVTDGVDGGNTPTNDANDADNASGDNNTINVVGDNSGNRVTVDNCQNSLGGMAWIVCTVTGTTSDAVDWLYDTIGELLVVSPVEAKDGTPIYEIWKYCRGITNIVFIIFLLVVIYSQITGVGISNYGLKKALPKLIVAAVLVNLSFLICQVGVDLSNVIGNGLRGVFTNVENTVMSSMDVSADNLIQARMAYAQLYNAISAGSVAAIGAGIISFESGAIWMLIPIILGALVAVVSGLITIALRQAVVALLVMIAPLAFVANILPNTEPLFKKWKKLLIQMLVFYPMFSLLFGASSLAGFAIMASAKDGFWLLIGAAVQVFPLFFSWSLMKMSGTILGTINARMHGIMARPLAASRNFASSRREAARAKHLASNRAYTPSLALRQYLANRKIARNAEFEENMATVKNRGLAYKASRNYDSRGAATKEGAREYEQQAMNMCYAEIIERDKNNMNKGLGALNAQPTNAALRTRLSQLDNANIVASDRLKMEAARGAMIEFENAKGFHMRISNAMDAHMDDEAINKGYAKRRLHGANTTENLARYDTMKDIMEGEVVNTHFIGADAAHAYNSQAQIVKGKFQNYFDSTVPTQDVVHRLEELTMSEKPSDLMDPIIAGLRTLNMRGDTDLLRQQVSNIMDRKKLELGTYASQSLASFLMFDVKGNDPFLRRLGKYINLETAAIYNDREVEDLSKRRTKKNVTMYEYVNGSYIDEDENGKVIYKADGSLKTQDVKKSAAVLLKGTSFKDMERTAIANMTESIRKYSVNPQTGEFDFKKFMDNEAAIWNAIMPNVIGDHFSYLSGSEQILAFGKGVTGVDVGKHQFDWDGIFGEDIAKTLTPEQKKKYAKFLFKRTIDFLGGQVPVQIAKTKSDMLEAIRNQYTLETLLDKDPDEIDKLIQETDTKKRDAKYKELEEKYLDDIKEKFVSSFKEDALKGFVKMHHKGYQGEAKDGLIKLLNPDELYKKYFPNGENDKNSKKNRQRQNDDEDEGMPVAGEDTADTNGSRIINSTSDSIERVFNEYRGSRSSDVEGFWREVKDIIENSDEMQVAASVIEDIEEILPQCTNVGALYSYIASKLFGGV